MAAIKSGSSLRLGSRQAQLGMSLIEVLASVLIFSIGVLGLVALQARATQYSRDAEDRNRAALLANEAVTLMWGNHSGNLPAVLPSTVYTDWVARVSNNTVLGLPNGTGTVTYNATTNLSTVTIQWQEPSRGSTLSQYITEVMITN